MKNIMHHEDDGTEREYWAIYDDSIAGQESIIGTYDTESEAILALSHME